MSSFFVILCFLLQCTVFKNLELGGITPNLMIIVTASYGFMRGTESGIWTGFFAGLLMDIFFGDLLGFYALLYLYVGYINGIFRNLFFPEDIKLPLVLILGSDLVYNLLFYVIAFLLKGKFDIQYYLLHIIIPEMLYTIVVTCAVYPLILLIENRLERKEKEG